MKFFSIIVIICLFSAIAIAATENKDNEKGPLEKITFIHYKKNFAKPAELAKSKPINCYGYLAAGAKWKTTEPYLVNPTNFDGLSESFVQTTVDAGVAKWEVYGGNIFGASSISYTADYNNGNLDGLNTVSFGTYDNPNVIAVTNVWGYFSGAPKTRQIIEWDLLFNDTTFAFGDASENPTLMDLQNITTHELGHSAGLADLYTTSCTEETMYGYSTKGETKKRDLYTGDIAGIQKLYSS